MRPISAIQDGPLIADTRAMIRCRCAWVRLLTGGVVLGGAVVAHVLGWIPMGAFRGMRIDVQRGTPEWWGLVVALAGVATGLILAGLMRRPRHTES